MSPVMPLCRAKASATVMSLGVSSLFALERPVGRQLEDFTSLEHEEHLQEVVRQGLEEPSQEQARLLAQLLLAGSPDTVARRVPQEEGGEKEKDEEQGDDTLPSSI